MLLLELFRRQRGWSQTETAHRASAILVRRGEAPLRQDRLSDYERGLHASPAHLRALASVLSRRAELLQNPVPELLDVEASRERIERQFAGQPDRARPRRLAAKPDNGVPEPPSLSEVFRRERGE